MYLFAYRPTTNAIMGLTFANYVIKPFFPDCDNPDQAVRLLAAAVICKKNHKLTPEIILHRVNTAIIIVYCCYLGFITFINCWNVKATTKVQNVFMFTKISALVLIIVCGGVYLCNSQYIIDNNCNNNVITIKYYRFVFHFLFTP